MMMLQILSEEDTLLEVVMLQMQEMILAQMKDQQQQVQKRQVQLKAV
jgi:hypothetical protein